MDDDLAIVDGLAADQDHRGVERALRRAAWEPCGAGDWAIVLRAPSGRWAARISPFDPAARYTAELYRRGAGNPWFPALRLHRDLDGGGALTVLELLEPVPVEVGTAVHVRLRDRGPDLAGTAHAIDEVHALARSEQEWWGPTDDNPANVMRALDGRLVVTDPFYADGPALYRAVLEEPGRVVRAYPRERRRFMLDLPLATTGRWEPAVRERMRAALEAADGG